jgi:hypothetical protein
MHETGADTITNRRYGFDPAPPRLWPVRYPDAPVLTWRFRIPGNNLDVQVRYYVSEHEAVDVFGAFDVAQTPRKAVDQLSQRGGFIIGEAAESGNVSLRLSH